MSTGYHLLDNPNPHGYVRPDGQYWGRSNRLDGPSGVITEHTAEIALDAIGDDAGAEAVASYFTHSDRAASYHAIHDSDSTVELLPPLTHTAYHVARSGINSHAIGHSYATRAAQWGQNPQWDEAALDRGGRWAAARIVDLAERGITVPVRRITVAEADAKTPGFIGHGELQADRSDPGWSDRLWSHYLDDHVTPHLGGPTVTAAIGELTLVAMTTPRRVTVGGWTAEPDPRVSVWIRDRLGQDLKLNDGSSFLAAGRADSQGRHTFRVVLAVPAAAAKGPAELRASMLTASGRWLAPATGSPRGVTLGERPDGDADIAAAVAAARRVIEILEQT